jgi:segregation and condensation protein A
LAATQPPEYAVRLDSFEGPLDLLLRLIEKDELDITTISLAKVTDQYLAYMRQLDEIHPDLLADFLVVAAKLILIKSRALLPRPPVIEEEEEDVGEDLVRQLEEYRRYKEAAAFLREREEQDLRSFVRVTPAVLKPRGLAPGEVSLEDLMVALQRALTAAPAPPVNTVVSRIVISIDDRIRVIENAVAGGRRVHFAGLLTGTGSRLEIIVTFLAILELIKRGRLMASQEGPFGEIYLTQASPEAAARADGTPEA